MSTLAKSSSEFGLHDAELKGSAQDILRPSVTKSSAAFRTISEVADDLGVQQHVLRFWETKFSQVKPLKRGGGRRYYRPEDVQLLRSIHRLLYTEGYTIKGVQKLLRDVGKKQIIGGFAEDHTLPKPEKILTQPMENLRPKQAEKTNVLSPEQREALEVVLSELKQLRGMIKPRHSS